jgi:alpha-ribazole phosphatase
MQTNHPRSVWLVRHGQTDWNLARRYLGVSDRPLTLYGMRQASALARFFNARKVDVIVHSGLARTEAVAQAITGHRQIPVVREAQWGEVSHGRWEGLTYQEVMRLFRAEAQARMGDPVNNAPEDGETLSMLAERVSAAWAALGEQYPGQRIVVVTHAAPIQAMLCALTHMPLAEYWRWRIDLGSATGIDCYPGTSIIRAVNVVPTLR